MKYIVTISEKKYEIGVNGESSEVTIDGRKIAVDMKSLSGGKLQSLLADNETYEFELERSNGGLCLWHGSGQISAEVIDEKTERLRQLMGGAAAGKKLTVLKASMPGLVLKVEVEPGQKIKKGDGLFIIEAMKMENEIRATSMGVVKEIKVRSGEAVEKNQVLVVFE